MIRIVLLLFGLLSGPTWAQDAEVLFGIVRIPVSEDAQVERHPAVREGMVEMVIRGCYSDLNGVISGRSNPYVAAMDAVYVGGGTWIVKAVLSREDVDLRVVIEEGHLSIDVVEGAEPSIDEEEEAPTVDTLVAGELPSAVANTEFPPLMFLHGNALSYAMESQDFVPMLPVPAALPRPSWHAIDRARHAMFTAQTDVALAQARYELGWLHLEMGFFREARYYFELLDENPGALRAMDVSLARARSALACRHWEEARQRLREAYRYGARESAVVEGFGVISLATGVPGRSITAKVLSRVTGRPEALLLAAELLQRDGYYAKSRPLLEALSGRVTGETAKRVSLRLGDARLMAGERDAAVRAYRDAPKGLGDFRVALVDLLEKGPTDWAAFVPTLSDLAQEQNEVGAEALYLLSQIDGIMGSPVDSVTDLAALIRNHRRIGAKSDAPERLWKIYAERQKMLIHEEKWFDVAALHEGAWHPLVRRAVDDPDLLIEVAGAYEQIGLPNRALYLTREVFPMLLRVESDDTDLIFRLARLYGETGDTREGLKTLEFLRSRRLSAAKMADIAMLAADLSEGAGDITGTVRELRRAALDRRYRSEATLRMARIDAEEGRCPQATDTLWRRLMVSDPVPAQDSRPYLALARCLIAQGQSARAAAAAKAAADRSDSPEETRYATYLATMSTQGTDVEALSDLEKKTDVWASLGADYAETVDLATEVEKRRERGRFAE